MKNRLFLSVLLVAFVAFGQNPIEINYVKNQDNSVSFYYKKIVPGSYLVQVYFEELTNTRAANSETKVIFPVSGDEAQFRQIAIVADPQEATSDNPPATEESYRGPKHPDFGTADEEPFDILTGSGKVLYTENRQPVARAIDQIEDIKVVFEF